MYNTKINCQMRSVTCNLVIKFIKYFFLRSYGIFITTNNTFFLIFFFQLSTTCIIN